SVGKATFRIVESDKPARVRIKGIARVKNIHELRAIGANILNRRSTHRAGNQREIFHARKLMVHTIPDQIIPYYTSGSGDIDKITFYEMLYTFVGHFHNRAVIILGKQHIAATSQNEKLLRKQSLCVQRMKLIFVCNFDKLLGVCLDMESIVGEESDVVLNIHVMFDFCF